MLTFNTRNAVDHDCGMMHSPDMKALDKATQARLKVR